MPGRIADAGSLDRFAAPASNMRMAVHIALIVAGYLLGSIASAVVVCRLLGLSDPRTEGSHNPGTTNVLRLHGKKAALMTLAGDLLKGYLPVACATFLGAPHWVTAAAGVAAFIGHLYPLFFGFQGGKGVATIIGVLLGIHWLLGGAFIATWLMVAALFRYSSLAAMTAALLTPIFTWLITADPAYVGAMTLLATILLWRHRSNMQSLVKGTEDKIGVDGNKASSA